MLSDFHKKVFQSYNTETEKNTKSINFKQIIKEINEIYQEFKKLKSLNSSKISEIEGKSLKSSKQHQYQRTNLELVFFKN